MIYGKKITHVIFDEMMPVEKKIVWISAQGRFTLAARLESDPFQWLVGVSEHDIDPIHSWCQENNCGKRVSFDTFCFRNREEMTMFLLRWA
jgi:hypothetical protein